MIHKELQISEFRLFQSKVLELFTETYIENFNITVNEANTICIEKVSLLEQYIDDGSAFVIASIEDGNLIGVIWLYLHEYFGEKRLHVNQIVVDKKYRGKGIGKSLIFEAQKKAANLGVKVIDLFVSEINKGAINLYERLGFETERRYMKKELQVIKQ